MIVPLYIACFVLLGTFILPLCGRGGFRRNLLNPGYLFLLSFLLGYFVLPVASLRTGTTRYDFPYSAGSHLKTMLFCGVFVVLFASAYNYFGGARSYAEWRTHQNRVSPLNRFQENMVVAVSLVLVLLGSIPILKLIAEHGIASYAANRIILGAGLGYATLLLTAGVTGFAILFANRLIHATPFKRLRAVKVPALLVISVTAGVLLFSRTRMLMPFALLFLLWILIRKRGQVNRRAFLALAACSALILSAGLFLGSAREAVMANKFDDIVGAERLADRLDPLVKSFGNQENLLWLMDYQRSALLGKTFAAVAVGFVPRALWTNKPVGGGPAIRNMIVPGSYDLETGESLTSYTTGLPAEAYMNFGWFGLGIAPLAGFLLAWLAGALKTRDTPIELAAMAFLIFYVPHLSYAEMFGLASHIFSVLVPLYVFSLAIRMKPVRYRRTTIKLEASEVRP